MKTPSNRRLLLKYAGLSFQLLAALAVTTYIGYWADVKFSLSIPVFVWLLPFLTICYLIFKIVQDVSKK